MTGRRPHRTAPGPPRRAPAGSAGRRPLRPSPAALITPRLDRPPNPAVYPGAAPKGGALVGRVFIGGGVIEDGAMSFATVVGTQDGVVLVEGGAARHLGLRGHRVSAVHALRDGGGDGVLLAGTYGEGLYRSGDLGGTWTAVGEPEGLWAPAARTIGPDPLQPGALVCGTEPGRLFRSADEGRTWSELAGFSAVPGVSEWYLPYSPRAGAVRNVWAPPGRAGHLLASVEVGGLLRSADGGDTWSVAPIGPNDDIHQVTGHPEDGDRLWASLGWAALRSRQRGDDAPALGGVGRSTDGGRTWDVLHTNYTRSTIVVPSQPDVVLSGPARAVGEGGRIETSTDGGASWQPAAGGIDAPMPDMVELFVPAPDDAIYAVCSGGRLLRATPGEWHWASALPVGQPDDAVSVSFLPR
jgi:photosystem II stability/assembly factor-like uncharacterized protein